MRRRRNRATWFPILGTDWTDNAGQPPKTVYPGFIQFPALTSEGVATEAQAVEILDDNDTVESETASLRDRVEGKDYAVKRIVGKIWAAASQAVGDAETIIPQIVVFCAAFAVLAVDETGQPESPSEEWNPLYSKNSAKPWMWRRTWVLYNNLVSSIIYTGPTNIANHGGGILDAGHIDVKVSRRVRKEERLFLVTTAMITDLSDHNGGLSTDPYSITWGVDVRTLGGMRRSQNRSVLT